MIGFEGHAGGTEGLNSMSGLSQWRGEAEAAGGKNGVRGLCSVC
jgi:hypothetical protein